MRTMGEVVAFPGNTANTKQGGELLQNAVENLEGSEVDQQVEETHSWIVEKFPHLFLTPGQLVTHLENVRHPAKFDPEKSLNDQVGTKKAA